MYNTFKISSLFYIIYFTSQFYIFGSGKPQITHAIFLLAFILFFKVSNFKIIINESTYLLLIFFSYTLFVNSLYYIFKYDFTFLISICYWLFNVILFIYLINLKNIDFNLLKKTILVSFFLILVFWFVGLGGYSSYPRYNGFFNDPNQMAFWVLASTSLYLLKRGEYDYIVLVISLFIIILTMSRSAMLGFAFILLGYFLDSKLKTSDIIKLFFVFLFVLLIGIFFFSSENGIIFFDRLASTDMDEQSDVRGFNAISMYPQYIFFGAGQGDYFRYSATGLEIHSNWIGILFYYGIVGLSLFLLFIFNIFNRLTLSQKLLFSAPMVYGMFTYSARTLIFWILLGVFLNYSNSAKTKVKDIL